MNQSELKTLASVRITLCVIIGLVSILISSCVSTATPTQQTPVETEYIGRVIDATTQDPIEDAKISLDLQSVPSFAYTDSEGIYRFRLSINSDVSGKIRVDAEGYQSYTRNITLSSNNNDLEDIRLIPHNTAATLSASPSLTTLETTTPFSGPTTSTSTRDSGDPADPENLDFETTGAWIFSPTSKYWSGQYSNDWATSGQKSYQIYILTDPVGSIYPGANTYGEIYQNINLSGVSELLFDMNAYGDWDALELAPNSFLSLEFWIDNQRIYSHERQEGTFFDQSIPLVGWTGIHKLSIRLNIHDDYNALPPGLGVYIDNVRLVREGITEHNQNNFSDFKVLIAGENYLQIQVNYIYIGNKGSEDVFLGITGLLADSSTLSGLGYTPEPVTIGSGTKTVTLWLDSVEPGTYELAAFETCFYIAGQSSFYCEKFPYTMVLNK